MQQQPKIFVSYRRTDSQHITDRLAERLESAFGKNRVFQDVDRVPLGADFRAFLASEIERCDVILLVIGNTWAQTLKEREADVDDFVRVEVEQALKQGKFIIPVLVDNARMPAPADLPASLSDLAYLNAARVRPNPDFRDDADSLIAQIRTQYAVRVKAARDSKPGPAPRTLPIRRLFKFRSAANDPEMTLWERWARTLTRRAPSNIEDEPPSKMGRWKRIIITSIGAVLAWSFGIAYFLSLFSRGPTTEFTLLVLVNGLLVGIPYGVGVTLITGRVKNRYNGILSRVIIPFAALVVLWIVVIALFLNQVLFASSIPGQIGSRGLLTRLYSLPSNPFTTEWILRWEVVPPIMISIVLISTLLLTRSFIIRLVLLTIGMGIGLNDFFTIFSPSDYFAKFETAYSMAFLMALGICLADRLAPQAGQYTLFQWLRNRRSAPNA